MPGWVDTQPGLPGRSLSADPAVPTMPIDDLTPVACRLGGKAPRPEPQTETCPRHVRAVVPSAAQKAWPPMGPNQPGIPTTRQTPGGDHGAGQAHC